MSIFSLDKHACTFVVDWAGQNELLCIMSVYIDIKDSLFEPNALWERMQCLLYYICTIIYNV